MPRSSAIEVTARWIAVRSGDSAHASSTPRTRCPRMTTCSTSSTVSSCSDSPVKSLDVTPGRSRPVSVTSSVVCGRLGCCRAVGGRVVGGPDMASPTLPIQPGPPPARGRGPGPALSLPGRLGLPLADGACPGRHFATLGRLARPLISIQHHKSQEPLKLPLDTCRRGSTSELPCMGDPPITNFVMGGSPIHVADRNRAAWRHEARRPSDAATCRLAAGPAFAGSRRAICRASTAPWRCARRRSRTD
jgi:hypothetical protein